MKRMNLNNWIGKAAMACLLSIPGMANAATLCSSVSPSYTYNTVASGGGYGSVTISAGPAGCQWHVVAHVAWITITSAATGIGPATVTFYVAPNPNKTIRRGTFGMEAVVESTTIGNRSSGGGTVTSGSFVVTLDEAAK